MDTYYYSRVGGHTAGTVFHTIEAARNHAAARLAYETSARKGIVLRRRNGREEVVMEFSRADPSVARWHAAYQQGDPAKELRASRAAAKRTKSVRR